LHSPFPSPFVTDSAGEYGYGDEPYPFGVPGKPVKAVTKIDWASFD